MFVEPSWDEDVYNVCCDSIVNTFSFGWKRNEGYVLAVRMVREMFQTLMYRFFVLLFSCKFAGKYLFYGLLIKIKV